MGRFTRSPVSDDGRGLKQLMKLTVMFLACSPVSDDGRGLKLCRCRTGKSCTRSPVSDDGRGLKLYINGTIQNSGNARPSVMTGVD